MIEWVQRSADRLFSRRHLPDKPREAAMGAARLGFAARGLVYLLVGVFAVDAAWFGHRPVDNQQVVGSLAHQPFGQMLVGLIALGLLGYALWRVSEALLDPERRGTEPKAIVERIGFAWSAVVHLLLAAYAARLALNLSRATESGDARAKGWSSWLMEQPGGEWIVGLIGLLLIGGAAAQAWKGYHADFTEELSNDAPAPERLCLAGRIGYGARALVFALVGGFFVDAALDSRPHDAGGIGQALAMLRDQPLGPVLLTIVAAGLALFGVYSLIEARYRRIRIGP